MGTLGGNTVYHMGTLSRASKNRDMARESEKQQQVNLDKTDEIYFLTGGRLCLRNNSEREKSLSVAGSSGAAKDEMR